MSGLDLRGHVEFCGAHDFCRATGGPAFRSPCRMVNAGMGAARHQFMIGRMKLDLVAPVAACIEGSQLWRILVGKTTALGHRRRTPKLPEFGQFLRGRTAAIGRDRLFQWRVQFEQIDLFERRRLVEHVVGRERRLGHGPSLTKLAGINGGAVGWGNHRPPHPRPAAKSATTPSNSSQSLAHKALFAKLCRVIAAANRSRQRDRSCRGMATLRRPAFTLPTTSQGITRGAPFRPCPALHPPL